MATIADVVAAGKEFGVFDFYLPFIIMFALVFGVLTKTKIFGDPKESRSVRNINIILSGAFALFVMIYTPVGVTIAQFMSSLFAETMIVLVTIVAILLMLFLLMPALGVDMEKIGMGKSTKALIFIIIIIALGVFLTSGGLSFFGINFGSSGTPQFVFPGIGLSIQDIALIITGISIVAILWWLTKGEGHEKRRGKTKLIEVPED